MTLLLPRNRYTVHMDGAAREGMDVHWLLGGWGWIWLCSTRCSMLAEGINNIIIRVRIDQVGLNS